MAAGSLNLFNDIVTRKLVYSATSQTEFFIAGLTQGNIVPVVFMVLQYTGSANVFAKPAIENMSLQFTLTDVPTVDAAGSTAFVTQYSWTKDTNLRTFSADISLTTAALNTWMSTASSKTATIRFSIVEGGNTTEIYRANVTIFAGAIAVLTVAAGETPLSYERAVATFRAKIDRAGDYYIRTASDGTQYQDTLSPDGIQQFNPLS